MKWRTRFRHREADAEFARFWDAYPKRVSKQDALKAWEQIRPNGALVEKMLVALIWQKVQPNWLEDGGAFIPYPATWLRGALWEDEPFHASLSPFKQRKVPDDEPL